MLVQGNRRSQADARISLRCVGTWYAIQFRAATKPKIAIQRDPEARLEIIAQVAFERAYGTLCLDVGTRRKLVM